MKHILVIVIMIVFSIPVYSQIAFEPPVVFVDALSKTCTMNIKNTGDVNKEIEINFKFGYSKYDSTGKPYVCYDDSVSSKTNSLAPYIKSFPKKFLLPPKSEQVVRFLIRGMDDLPDGTYWTRVAATAKDEEKQIDSTASDKITATISIIVETVNIIYYQKGDVNTGVDLDGLIVDSDSINYIIRLFCERTGNSPFLGSMLLALYDEDGKLVVNEQKKTAVYYEIPFRFRIEKNLLKPGKYRAEVTVTNEREDISEQNRIPFQPLTKSFAFTIP